LRFQPRQLSSREAVAHQPAHCGQSRNAIAVRGNVSLYDHSAETSKADESHLSLVGVPLKHIIRRRHRWFRRRYPSLTWLGLGARRAGSLKLDAALLYNGSLLNRDHLAFHLGKFSGRLFIAADKKCRRPKYDNRRSSCYPIISSLLVLHPR
jgi:hypothetical protein